MHNPKHWALLGALLVIFLPSALAGDSDPTVAFDRRLQIIAGDGAVNCGHVTVQENTRKANKCVRMASSAKKAFYVRYDLHGTDSLIGAGLAGSGIDVYLVEFDSTGWTPGLTKSGERLMDDGQSIVKPCTKPIRLRSAASPGRGLTCLSPDMKNHDIMSPQ